MNYYPVAIPTLCRYERFKRCVESLSQNTGADKTELVIGLDYPPSEKYREGYERIKDFIPTISGFRKVTVFYRENNYGAVNNSLACKAYCLEHYNAYIGTEDDNEFSPCFLDFMNKALEKYAEDDTIESVSGWTPKEMYNDEYGCYLDYSSSAWGVGRWKHKENKIQPITESNDFIIENLLKTRVALKILKDSPRRLNNNLNMVNNNENWGDVRRGMVLQIYGLTQLRPCISLVRNLGYDGSGLHCKKDDRFSKQEISKESLFDINCKVADQNYSKFIEYKRSEVPKNIFVRIAFYGVIITKYAVFRLKHFL